MEWMIARPGSYQIEVRNRRTTVDLFVRDSMDEGALVNLNEADARYLAESLLAAIEENAKTRER